MSNSWASFTASTCTLCANIHHKVAAFEVDNGSKYRQIEYLNSRILLIQNIVTPTFSIWPNYWLCSCLCIKIKKLGIVEYMLQ